MRELLTLIRLQGIITHTFVNFCELILRIVVEKGKPAWRKIKETFGKGVLHADGTINREALGLLVFNDRNKRHKLDAIVHPEIFKEMAWQYVKYALNVRCPIVQVFFTL